VPLSLTLRALQRLGTCCILNVCRFSVNLRHFIGHYFLVRLATWLREERTIAKRIRYRGLNGLKIFHQYSYAYDITTSEICLREGLRFLQCARGVNILH
jgi:hypothetical protein